MKTLYNILFLFILFFFCHSCSEDLVGKITTGTITGKVVKSFKGNFGENHEFSISNLPASLYIVKITNDAKEENTLKIIKLN